jgi:outer membrane protein TolC
VQQQKALKADSLEVKTRLAKAEYDTLTLRHTLASQQEQLNNLLGLDIRTAFRVNPVADTMPGAQDQTAASARALAQRPELKEAQLKVQLVSTSKGCCLSGRRGRISRKRSGRNSNA